MPIQFCHKGHEFSPDNTRIRPNDGYRECRECIRLRAKKWRDSKPESSRDASARWRNNHPEERREKSLRDQITRRYKIKDGDFKSWMRRYYKFHQDNKCHYCNCDISEKYHLEHMTPLSKGGPHSWENTCLSCPSCNLQKGAKTVEEFTSIIQRDNAPSCSRKRQESSRMLSP